VLLNVAFVVLSLPVLIWTGYLSLLALLSRANPVPPYEVRQKTRFDVIVPAHDEEAGIAATVDGLLGIDYPRDLYRVIVVADNCLDGTAVRAAEAGALVMKRDDSIRRGKGYALAYGFERSLTDAFADAVVVVDADTKVTPNLLHAFAARLSKGARAAQAEYAVANSVASWRTRLMHIAFALFHDVRSRARQRLGVSTGLRGNGMMFERTLLREFPHDAFSIVEDVEYGIRIGLAGHRVHYVGEARVFGEMVTAEGASRSQRRRWEGGRWLLARKHAARLLLAALRRRSLILFDLAADLVVPPLTYVALALAVGLGAASAWVGFGHGRWWSFAPWCVSAVFFALYVIRGAWLARVGMRVVLDLLWAPVYMVWKVALALRPSPSREGEWVRTTREAKKP
jgi:cellulose synthase/poly-beta-1,6-N-acetylglucosamine synthase-like glycosyltransferase